MLSSLVFSALVNGVVTASVGDAAVPVLVKPVPTLTAVTILEGTVGLFLMKASLLLLLTFQSACTLTSALAAMLSNLVSSASVKGLVTLSVTVAAVPPPDSPVPALTVVTPLDPPPPVGGVIHSKSSLLLSKDGI